MNDSQFNKNMRAARKLNDIKQEIISHKLGVSQNTYSRLERGKIKMTEEKKKKIAEAFDTTEEIIEDFHRRPVFINNDQTGGHANNACSITYSEPENANDGYRIAIGVLQNDNAQLKEDKLALFNELQALKAERKEEKAEISQLRAELTAAKSDIIELLKRTSS
jgi:transcriptional regulator with XRE-family HTH domain